MKLRSVSGGQRKDLYRIRSGRRALLCLRNAMSPINRWNSRSHQFFARNGTNRLIQSTVLGFEESLAVPRDLGFIE